MTLYPHYFIAFLAAFLLAVVFTIVIKRVALILGIIDYPNSPRKIHDRPIPLLGGVAIFLSFFLVVFYFAYNSDLLIGNHISLKNIWALFLAALLLVIGGVLDDKFNLPAKKQIIWPVLAALVAVAGGIGVSKITNPFGGGVLNLDAYSWTVFTTGVTAHKIVFLADIFAFVWLLIMIYATKLLDGLDGLVSGIGTIGAIIIFLLSTATKWWQPETAILSIVLAGACAGFLIFNFNPAKIFLGESGAMLIGFLLGILAIISGGKIATTLLVMGFPLLDILWVFLRRTFWEKKDPFRTSDKKHLHFRLVEVGLSVRQAVLLMYFLAIVFGLSTLFLQSRDKLIALVIIALLMVIIGSLLVLVYRKKEINN